MVLAMMVLKWFMVVMVLVVQMVIVVVIVLVVQMVITVLGRKELWSRSKKLGGKL